MTLFLELRRVVPFLLTEAIVVLTRMKHPSSPGFRVSFQSIGAEVGTWNEQSEQLVFQ